MTNDRSDEISRGTKTVSLVRVWREERPLGSWKFVGPKRVEARMLTEAKKRKGKKSE